MNTLALYHLADEYKQDLAKLADLDLDEKTLADTIESMGGELEVKATQVGMFIRNCESTIDAMKKAEKELTERRKRAEVHVAVITKYLKDNMERCGILKIEGPALSLKIKKNPAGVVIDDEGLIPPFYWRQPPTPEPPPRCIDKDAIKAAIGDNEEVPGARVVQATRLEIKA